MVNKTLWSVGGLLKRSDTEMSGKWELSFGHSMDKIGKFPVKILSLSINKQEEGENIISEKWELLDLEETMMVNIIETLNIQS